MDGKVPECPRCHITFEVGLWYGRRNPKQKYCSGRCASLDWKSKHKDWISEWGRKNRCVNALRERNKRIKYNVERRDKMFDILGDCCVKCGFKDKRALQFDHIRGGGQRDYRERGGNIPMLVYYLKHPEEAKENLQVLCANCNFIKRIENNELRKSILYPSV